MLIFDCIQNKSFGLAADTFPPNIQTNIKQQTTDTQLFGINFSVCQINQNIKVRCMKPNYQSILISTVCQLFSKFRFDSTHLVIWSPWHVERWLTPQSVMYGHGLRPP